MAVDTRAAERELERKLMTLSSHRRDLEAFRNEGDAAGVARSEQLLEFDYGAIREHCAEHGLELPHDVPPESAA